MRALLIATTAVVTISIVGGASAQSPSVRDMMNDMKARYGKTFDECRDLAVSRGHSVRDDHAEVGAGHPFLMFIEGCVQGRQI